MALAQTKQQRMTSRQYTDHLINIYLNALSSVSNDAGWSGESMLSRLIEFQGDIPMSTGNCQSNGVMMKAVRLLEGEHEGLKKIAAVVTELLADPKHSHKMLALLSKHYYRGLNPATNKPYTDEDRMSRIGQHHILPTEKNKAEARFRRYIREIYKDLERELARFDRYRAAL